MFNFSFIEDSMDLDRIFTSREGGGLRQMLLMSRELRSLMELTL